MPSPQVIKGVDKRGLPLRGLKVGKITELTMQYKVKPGHEKLIRAAIENFCTEKDPNRSGEHAVVATGIQEMRLILIDNDTRLIWMTSFDTDWDTYIDDTIAITGTPKYGRVLMHIVEAPEGIEKPDLPNASNVVKDLFNAHRFEAAGILMTFGNLSVGEVFRSSKVSRAFDEVLKNPKAAEALQHPALAPLLELAAD